MNRYVSLLALALCVVHPIRCLAEIPGSRGEPHCEVEFAAVGPKIPSAERAATSRANSASNEDPAFRKARRALTEYYGRGYKTDDPELDALYKKIADGDERALAQLKPGSRERLLLDDIIRQSQIVEQMLVDQRLQNPHSPDIKLPAFIRSTAASIWKRAIQFMRRPLPKSIDADNFSTRVKNVAPERRLREFKKSLSAFPLITHEEMVKVLSAFPQNDQAAAYEILAPKVATKGSWQPVKELVTLVSDLEPGVAGKILGESGYEGMTFEEGAAMLSAFPIRGQRTVFNAVKPRLTEPASTAPSYLLAHTAKLDPALIPTVMGSYARVPADRVAELAASSPTELPMLLAGKSGVPNFKIDFPVEALLPNIQKNRPYSYETVGSLADVAARAGMSQTRLQKGPVSSKITLIDYMLSKGLVAEADVEKVKRLKLDDLQMFRGGRPKSTSTSLTEPVDAAIQRIIALKPSKVETTPMTTKQVDALNREVERYVAENAGALSFSDLRRIREASVHYTLNVVDPRVSAKNQLDRKYSDGAIDLFLDHHLPKLAPEEMVATLEMVHVLDRPKAAANYLLMHPEVSVDQFESVLGAGWFNKGSPSRRIPKEAEPLVRHYVRQNLPRLAAEDRPKLAANISPGPLRQYILTATSDDNW